LKNLYNSGFWTIFAEYFMPIYAYRCEACGFAKDVLQKISDDTVTVCSSCGQDAFRKQVTAAGFQLKGSGWYVTDFRNGSGGAAKTAAKTAAGNPATAAQPLRRLRLHPPRLLQRLRLRPRLPRQVANRPPDSGITLCRRAGGASSHKEHTP
jgi:putative FmdB family regulatory protein